MGPFLRHSVERTAIAMHCNLRSPVVAPVALWALITTPTMHERTNSAILHNRRGRIIDPHTKFQSNPKLSYCNLRLNKFNVTRFMRVEWQCHVFFLFRLSYFCLLFCFLVLPYYVVNISNLVDVRHLGFERRSGFSQFCGLICRRTCITQPTKFQQNHAMHL